MELKAARVTGVVRLAPQLATVCATSGLKVLAFDQYTVVGNVSAPVEAAVAVKVKVRVVNSLCWITPELPSALVGLHRMTWLPDSLTVLAEPVPLPPTARLETVPKLSL